MRVLTYVGNILTVIAGDKFYSGESDKPSFITGKNFYYEPTQKMMDDKSLLEKQVLDAEAFISSYKFPEVINVAPLKATHRVDASGNYIGFTIEGTEVPEAPSHNLKFPYWDGSKFVEGSLAHKDTGAYLGDGDTRVVPNSYYVPKIGETPFEVSAYYWVDSKWVISIEDAKRHLKEKLALDYVAYRSIITVEDITYNGGYDSAQRLDTKRRFVESLGGDEVSYLDINNKPITLTMAQAQRVCTAIYQASEDEFYDYKAKQKEIEECTTLSQLETYCD